MNVLPFIMTSCQILTQMSDFPPETQTVPCTVIHLKPVMLVEKNIQPSALSIHFCFYATISTSKRRVCFSDQLTNLTQPQAA